MTAVGIGPVFFYDPRVCPKLNTGILAYLDRHGVGWVLDLTGSLVRHDAVSACEVCVE